MYLVVSQLVSRYHHLTLDLTSGSQVLRQLVCTDPQTISPPGVQTLSLSTHLVSTGSTHGVLLYTVSIQYAPSYMVA